MKLRTGSVDDIPVVQALEKTARLRYRAVANLTFVADAPPLSAERIQAGDLTVAEIESQCVGFILTNVVDERLYITNISVAPQASGLGIGKALIESAVDQAGALGLGAVTLTTFLAPAWNRPWFIRLGFAKIPDGAIGPGLRQIIERQSTSVDPDMRIALWLKIPAPTR